MGSVLMVQLDRLLFLSNEIKDSHFWQKIVLLNLMHNKYDHVCSC